MKILTRPISATFVDTLFPELDGDLAKEVICPFGALLAGLSNSTLWRSTGVGRGDGGPRGGGVRAATLDAGRLLPSGPFLRLESKT